MASIRTSILALALALSLVACGDDGVASDTGTGSDTGTAGDTGTSSDTGTAGDTGTDTGTAGDTGTSGDTGTAGDTGASADASDTGTSGDASGTPCGTETCDPATEVCFECACGGPTSFTCMAVPSACSADRTCSCLGSMLCTTGLAMCTDRSDNHIYCDTGLD